MILASARAFAGTESPPRAIILTHGHFDHVGALEGLADVWKTSVYAHPLEHPYLNGSAAYPEGDPLVGGGLMAALSRFYPTKPVDVSDCLKALPEDGTVPFMPGWRWLHTPGHSPGHISLYRDQGRTIIAGDASLRRSRSPLTPQFFRHLNYMARRSISPSIGKRLARR